MNRPPYSTLTPVPPKRPVISSLAAGTAALSQWLHENCLSRFRDREGQAWEVSLKVTQIPDEGTPHGLLWSLRISLRAVATGVELVATGVLCPHQDARLLALLGPAKVPLVMRPLVYQAPHEAACRQLLAQVLPEVRDNLAQQDLRGTKRELVGRWIDAQGIFGRGL